MRIQFHKAAGKLYIHEIFTICEYVSCNFCH